VHGCADRHGRSATDGLRFHDRHRPIREEATVRAAGGGLDMAEPGVFEVMYTMRAMRRLKPDAVPLELIRKVIEAGTQAPSGQNTQPWRFLVLTEPADKQFVQQRYYAAMKLRFGNVKLDPNDPSPIVRTWRAAQYLAEHLHETPVLLFVCGRRDWPAAIPEQYRTYKAPPSYGSVYPCAQNMLLACRALGLGASLTTAHVLFEEELQERFGVPDEYGMVAMLPIGYPKGRFGSVTRTRGEELTYYGRWGSHAHE
jgi:nitroreductase